MSRPLPRLAGSPSGREAYLRVRFRRILLASGRARAFPAVPRLDAARSDGSGWGAGSGQVGLGRLGVCESLSRAPDRFCRRSRAGLRQRGAEIRLILPSRRSRSSLLPMAAALLADPHESSAQPIRSCEWILRGVRPGGSATWPLRSRRATVMCNPFVTDQRTFGVEGRVRSAGGWVSVWFPTSRPRFDSAAGCPSGTVRECGEDFRDGSRRSPRPSPGRSSRRSSRRSPGGLGRRCGRSLAGDLRCRCLCRRRSDRNRRRRTSRKTEGQDRRFGSWPVKRAAAEEHFRIAGPAAEHSPQHWTQAFVAPPGTVGSARRCGYDLSLRRRSHIGRVASHSSRGEAAKLATRCGMGSCQGRVCGAALYAR